MKILFMQKEIISEADLIKKSSVKNSVENFNTREEKRAKIAFSI